MSVAITTKQESTPTVIALNTLLANYKIYFHKLLNYQWLIQASSTPELNEELHQYAEEAEEQMDAIVTEIERLGAVPVGNWSKWQKRASIQFKIPVRGAHNILNKIIEDIKQLDASSKLVGHSAREKDQTPIDRLASRIQQRLSERMNCLQQLRRDIPAVA